MISIIILAYNCEDYINLCIESCLSQTRRDLIEVIVINDGSTDRTKKILLKYKKNIKIFNRKNMGIEKSFNFALSKIKGDFFVRLDADDLLHKNYIEYFYKHLNKKYDFFYSNYDIINHNNLKISHSNLPKFSINEIFKRGDFLATGTIYKKSVLRVKKGYSVNVKNCGLENYEFILDLIKNKKRGLLLKKKLWMYRKHIKNLSKLNKKKITLYGKNLFKEKNYGIFQTNNYHPWRINEI